MQIYCFYSISDNGSVWTDSCVEFFSIPAGDGIYYNIECNCIGTILVGAGPVRNNREHAPKEVTALVQRWSSLGNQPFAERIGETDWEVALIIPYSVFFKHQIDSLDHFVYFTIPLSEFFTKFTIFSISSLIGT